MLFPISGTSLQEYFGGPDLYKHREALDLGIWVFIILADGFQQLLEKDLLRRFPDKPGIKIDRVTVKLMAEPQSAPTNLAPQYWITLTIIRIHHTHTTGAKHRERERSAKFTVTWINL
jgi:hypothetical protein